MPGLAYTRVTASGIFGTISAPDEIWSWSFGIAATIQSPDNMTGDVARAVKDQVVGFHQRPETGCSEKALLTEVKISLKTDLHRDAAPPVVFVIDHLPGGGATDLKYPTQISLAVSLGASTDTRKAKGRFYLPAPTYPIDPASSRISAVNTQRVADSASQFLNAVKAASGQSVIVASLKDGNHVVHTVRVGDVYDTIRTRRNKERETYSLAPVA